MSWFAGKTRVSFRKILSPFHGKPRWRNYWRKLLYGWLPSRVSQQADLPLLRVHRVLHKGFPKVLVGESHVVHHLDPFKSILLKEGIEVTRPVVRGYDNCTILSPYELGLESRLHHSDDIFETTHSCASKCSLQRPKHQSGAYLVCPTIRNDTLMLSLRPTITVHARYCIMYRFLF